LAVLRLSVGARPEERNCLTIALPAGNAVTGVLVAARFNVHQASMTFERQERNVFGFFPLHE
jgi:hypothetical protein